jgi:hypothetical protein
MGGGHGGGKGGRGRPCTGGAPVASLQRTYRASSAPGRESDVDQSGGLSFPTVARVCLMSPHHHLPGVLGPLEPGKRP